MKFDKKGFLTECSIPFRKDLIPAATLKGRKRFKLTDPYYVTVHNPGNKGTAEEQSHYVDYSTRYADWTWTIGNNIVLQEMSILVNTWHAGDGTHGTGNRCSLSIEVEETPEAEKTAQIFLRELLEYFPNMTIYPHKHWSDKECPRMILPHWKQFIKMIESDEIITMEVETMLTNKEKQSVLKSEGFYKGAIDGDFGPKSQAARKAFAEAKMEEIFNGETDMLLEDQVKLNTQRIDNLEKKL